MGHAHDLEALTGCTVVLCGEGAIAGMTVPGSAAGTRQTDSVQPGHLVDRIHGLCLTGGSSFGLAACDGAAAELARSEVGFPVAGHRIPILPGAVIFDLRVGDGSVRPTAAMGRKAARRASDRPVEQGCVGAGAGATVGKVLGIECACKSGLGSAGVVTEDGLQVGGLAVVNAFGDVRDPESGKLVAGARISAQSRKLVDTSALARLGGKPSFGTPGPVESTTLLVAATNARLDRLEVRKVAQMAAGALFACLSPPSTMVDGDVVFFLSVGSFPAELHRVSILARDVLEASILRAVRSACAAGGLPAHRDLALT